MTTISIVIRAFNEERHIGRLLTGIRHQSLSPDEVIVVDSGSTDATLDIAEQFGVITVTIEPERFSFGRSLNLGCETASSDLVVIVSAHVYPVADSWLKELTSPLSDGRVALAYGRQIGDPASRFSEARLLARWYPPVSEPHQDHPFCNNANAAVRRRVWEKLRYDESLTGLEDLDWARRAQSEGYRIAYVAEAPVVHVHEESNRQVFNRYRREAVAYKAILGSKGVGRLETLGLALRNIGSDYWHALRQRALVGNLLDIPAFRLAQFWGTYRGFSHRGEIPAKLKRRFYYPPEAVADRPMVKPTIPGIIDYSSVGEKGEHGQDH